MSIIPQKKILKRTFYIRSSPNLFMYNFFFEHKKSIPPKSKKEKKGNGARQWRVMKSNLGHFSFLLATVSVL